MAQTTSCRFCGYNIDVEIALLNTGRPDVCDNCAIEKRSEVKEQQIIETLATKVMEWRQVNLGISIAWVDSEGRDISAQVDSWNPLHNIADAWQLAEKAFGEEWFLHRHDGGYSFKGVTPDGRVGNSYLEESKEKAICNAVWQTLQEGCNFLGECACCHQETELMPLEEGGICQDCAQQMNDLAP
jgi:hypothetical protein